MALNDCWCFLDSFVNPPPTKRDYVSDEGCGCFTLLGIILIILIFSIPLCIGLITGYLLK